MNLAKRRRNRSFPGSACLAALLLSTLTPSASFAQAKPTLPSAERWLSTAPEALPPVTVRWEDPNQSEIFVVEGARYTCRVATNPGRILSLTVDGKNLLGAGGATLRLIDAAGHHYAPAAPGTKPNWQAWRRRWVPATNAHARMNVWSAGPYYWDAHLLEIPMVREGASPTDPPLRGELIFHAQPDQLRIQFRVTGDGKAAAPAQAVTAALVTTDQALQNAVTLPQNRPAGILGGAAAAVLGSSGATFAADSIWAAPLGPKHDGALWIVRPLAPGQSAGEAFRDETDRLPASGMTVTGGTLQGWDAAAGLYRIDCDDPNPAAYAFEPSFTNPARRRTTALHLTNPSAHPRTILVECHTRTGNLEASVLTDRYGFPLPVPTQVSKNFSGELEEPDDSAYGDTYFPVVLNPGESRTLQVIQVNQNWGTHALKQVSSLRFFNIYWHLSTGASETTCFTQNWMRIGESQILHIPDFRPLSGPFWAGQPQHDCLQWPGFLQYNDGKGRLIYERTVFESVSPNLTRFSLLYHTSDNAGTAKLSVMEIPQRDEMRTFIHLRYDWQKPVTIDGDSRENFRWLNIFEKQTPGALFWTDAGGATQTKSVVAASADTTLMLGEPLSEQSPFAAAHAAPFTGIPQSDQSQRDYHSLVLVRAFRARLGGKDQTRAALSAKFTAKNGSYWLTVPGKTLTLQPGDFVDADIMLMPHSGPTVPAQKPEQERTERFGAGIAAVDVTLGTKIADFPATLQARNEAAQFTLTGGFDQMPVIVEGFKGWGVPLLWRGSVWQDQQLRGGDGGQVEPDGHGGYRFVLLYPIRTGQKIGLTVTRAACSSGIARIFERNGSVILDAPAAGDWNLQAPVLFGPGVNTLSAKSPLVAFRGSAKTIRSLPVSVTTLTGTVVATLDTAGTRAVLRGAPARVTFSGLVPSMAYTLTINGARTRKIAGSGGSIVAETTASQTVVTCIRG